MLRGFRTRVQLPPVPPTKKELLSTKSSFFVIQAAGLEWNQRAPRVVWNCDEVAHGIARSAYRIQFLRLDAIHGVAVIPSSPLGCFHTATSCGFHTRLCLDLFTKLWYNNFNNIKFDKGVQLYEIHFC